MPLRVPPGGAPGRRVPERPVGKDARQGAVLWDGDGAHGAAAVVATAGSFVLTGEVRAHAATPSDVPIVAGLPIANAEAAQVEAGATLAVLQFVSRRASTPFASVVLGSAWGVSDGSHLAGAVEAASDLLLAAGCNTTDWSEDEIELIDGWEDLGEGRLQGNLF